MAEALPQLSLNPLARVEVIRIGEEKQPVFIVDEALSNAEALIYHAASATFGPPPQGALYPGLVAHLPPTYLPAISPALQRPMIQLFGMAPGRKPSHHGFFGLSTLSPEAMAPRQMLPHTDSANLHSFASVHFLSTEFGGTAFFRHRATGFEVVTHTRSNDFNKSRTDEISACADPAQVLRDCYEEIAYVAPVFNRLVFYRATQLHSAKIENSAGLNNDPRHGRLTANAFFNT